MTLGWRELVCEFEVPGIHTEKLGSGNQQWDEKVRARVMETLQDYQRPSCPYDHFELESVWYVKIQAFPRDVDNLRIKPALDGITATRKVWEDDRIPIVRTVDRHAIVVNAVEDERLVVCVYGVREGGAEQLQGRGPALGPLWAQMNRQPRHLSRALADEQIPATPGVYAWYEDSEARYVGQTGSLRARIWSNHLQRGANLGDSALRRNVAEDLGIAKAADIKAGRYGLTAENVAQVNERILSGSFAWIECASAVEASNLEDAMKREWKPPLNKR